jgi:hypothetical protein
MQQITAIKVRFGPPLNGIADYGFWLPWAGLARLIHEHSRDSLADVV